MFAVTTDPFVNTDLAGFIPEVWPGPIMEELFAKAVSANFYGRDTVSTQKQTARIAAEPADLNWVGADLVLSGRVSDAVTEMLRLTGGQVKFSASASFSANGSVATALSSVGPTGAQTTVQEWLTIKNASGTVRYIPCF